MNQFLAETELEPANEVRVEDDWGVDDIDLSSDFDLGEINVEASSKDFSENTTSHANCVPLEQYQREKQEWEATKKECEAQSETVKNLEKKVQRYEQLVEMLQNGSSVSEPANTPESGENGKNDGELERLTQEVEDGRVKLEECMQELSRFREKMQELEMYNQELEDKLYGPMNYYYAEYKKVAANYEVLEEEKNALADQLTQVKNIMREMILEQAKESSGELAQQERESFAKQIAMLEGRVKELEEENQRLQPKRD